MSAPLFGRIEKAFRERSADELNYGDRRQSRDAEIADPARPARDAPSIEESEAAIAPSPIFSSPLPDHAFRTGDLHEETPEISTRAIRPTRPAARLGVGKMFMSLFTRR